MQMTSSWGHTVWGQHIKMKAPSCRGIFGGSLRAVLWSGRTLQVDLDIVWPSVKGV